MTNGLRGTADYRYNWLGYEESDFEAIIDLEEVKTVNQISSKFLQNINSWIFLPEYLDYYYSKDGSNFTKLERVKHNISLKSSGSIEHEFENSKKNFSARYLKIFAKNIGKCPPWHKGSFGKAAAGDNRDQQGRIGPRSKSYQ